MIFLLFLYPLLVPQVQSLKYDIVSDYSVDDCLMVDNNDKQNYFGIDADKFPYCSKYKALTTCDPTDSKSCPPGLKCGDSGECEVDTNSCFKYYANVQGNENIQKLLWTPDCSGDGSWAPKQCKGGSAGRCFCYDMKGQRIFGDSFNENSVNMTCACSRRKAELLDSSNPNRRTYVSFHCDYQGNYEELQCDSGHCWCVEPKTGRPISMIVPEKSMKYLPCSKTLQGSQYLRKCESQAYAQTKIIEIMKRHGTSSPNIQVVACGNDGSYGPYKIQNPSIYCVKRNNEKMSYHQDITNLRDINCNCAHDSDLYDRLGKPFTLVCQDNGNYVPLQRIVEDNKVKRFCVDSDGNKKVDSVDEKENDEYCKKFYD
ncbi:uncharacterized protein LOC123677951 isoform X1 [Harmonia axyridis]|uniref:uncharacterized protein LOC123677951 isoform X1 n=1 Tax=Harmonia axyridis TaxID=115357 RepID=UPI001E27851D|nr:uncharacterized protein LOC123677951 isoform X1 [Harmonia axyridis]